MTGNFDQVLNDQYYTSNNLPQKYVAIQLMTHK